MPIKNRFAELYPRIVKWRHDFHRNPELQYELPKTAAKVADLLRSFGCDEVVEGVGKSGVVGVIHGQVDTSRRVIGLRADMDALPIDEKSDVLYKSEVPGVMHACGHDGHTAMLLGAAQYLCETKNFDGKAAVIFQPAEEGGAGAKAMIDDGLVTRFNIDEFYGIHNMPGIETGKFAIRQGPLMASADRFKIILTGKGGHAAQPQYANDPMVAAGLTITALQSLISRQLDPFKSAVLSITKIEGGSAFNVIPDTVTIGGTLRSTDQKNRNEMLDKIKKVASNTCAISNCEVNIEIRPGYPPTINNKECAKLASKIFKKTFGDNSINLKETPTMGSEDFSYMLEEKPGAYIWLGAGASSE